jgi:Fic family protein
MALTPTQIDDRKYYQDFHKSTGHQIEAALAKIDPDSANFHLLYQTQVSAVYSSNIEGNSIDLNSYMNAKDALKNIKEVQEIDDLIAAYQFAQNHPLNQKNLLEAHQILSKEFLIKSNQGVYRKNKVGVFGAEGLVYLAVEHEHVEKEMGLFFEKINALFEKNLNTSEAFYYAALYHLKFAHIHPFADGNGRVARLLEKWFLSKFVGERAWGIASEKFYKEHQSTYYQTINLGVNYYELDYDRCLPFIKMLAQAVIK